MFIKPKNDCEHLNKNKLIDPKVLQDFSFDYINLKCKDCNSNSNQLSLCLSCSEIFCSNTHLFLHIMKTGHQISISLDNLSIFCSECKHPSLPMGSYIKVPQLYKYIQYLFENKNEYTTFELFSQEEIYNIKKKQFISKFKELGFKNIVFMVGAGISTTAGIPDFRSKTGLFQQLQEKYNMSSPEEFFYKSTFLEHPEYFYEFTKNFDLSQTKPTLTHKFMAYLVSKGVVKYIFTQNIDGLEIKAKIPKEKMIFAHGTFTEGHCPVCKVDVNIEEINKCIQEGTIKHCDICGGPCKPKVVFYGEQLPDEFFDKANNIRDSDLGIVIGTSLQVYPFSYLTKMIGIDAWRIIINKTFVGKFGYEFLSCNSLFFEGTSDDIIKELVKECGWEEDFNKFNQENYGES